MYPVPLLQRLFRKLTLKLGYKCVDEIAPRDTKSRWSKTLHLSNSPHLTVITVLLFIFDTGWGSHNWLFFMDVWSLRWLYEKSVIYYVYLQLLQLICEFIATRILGYKCVDEIAPRDTKSRWSKTLHLSNSPHLTVITVLLFIFDTGWGSHNWLFFMDVWSLRWLYEKSVIYYVYLQLLQLICEFIATRIPWKGQPRAQFSNQGYG